MYLSPNISDILAFKHESEDFLRKLKARIKPSPVISSFFRCGEILAKRKTWSFERRDQLNTWLKTAKSNPQKIAGKDLSAAISALNELLAVNIELDEVYNDIRIKAFCVLNLSKLAAINKANKESINTLYTLIRIFQKNTKRTSSNPSEMAISAARRSANSVRTVYARH